MNKVALVLGVVVLFSVVALVFFSPSDSYLKTFEKKVKLHQDQYMAELGGIVHSSTTSIGGVFLLDHGITPTLVMDDTELGEFKFHVFRKEFDQLKPCEEYSPSVRVMCDFIQSLNSESKNVTYPSYLEPKSYVDHQYLTHFANNFHGEKIGEVCSGLSAFHDANPPLDICEARNYAKAFYGCFPDLTPLKQIADMNPKNLTEYLCYYRAYKDYASIIGAWKQ